MSVLGMMCEVAAHDRMTERANDSAEFHVACNMDDFLWNSVEPEESGPKVQETQI